MVPVPIWVVSLYEKEIRTQTPQREEAQMTAIHSPEREASEETNPANTLTDIMFPASTTVRRYISVF